MADRITPRQRSDNMRRIRSRDTGPELLVRQTVHRLGYRYRLHRKNLPGKPDLVFGPRRKVIFVHGCFWHQHPGCKAGRLPQSNPSYWHEKLRRNIARDEKTHAELTQLGWDVLTVWDCETKDNDALRQRLNHFLGERQTQEASVESVD